MPRFSLSFRKNQSGSVGPIFGVTFITLVTFVGVAVDYTNAARDRADLQAAADSATLAGANHLRAAIEEGRVTSRRGRNVARAEAKVLAINLFRNNAEALPRIQNVRIKDRENVDQTTSSVSIDFTAEFKRWFPIPSSTIKVAGSSKAGGRTENYVDIEMLVDLSDSMSFAATQQDALKLREISKRYFNKREPKIECAFACHQPVGSGDTDSGMSLYDFCCNPNTSGVSQRPVLRIDAVRSAIDQLIETFLNAQENNEQYRITIYGFRRSVFKILPPTLVSDLDDASRRSAVLSKLVADADDGNGNTNLQAAHSHMRRTRPSRSGTHPDSRSKYFILITDGVGDVYDGSSQFANNTYWAHRLEIFGNGESDCKREKSRFAAVGVMYTRYIHFPDEVTYQKTFAVADYLKSPLSWTSSPPKNLPLDTGSLALRKMSDAIKECASTVDGQTWFWDPTHRDEIMNATQELGAKIIRHSTPLALQK